MTAAGRGGERLVEMLQRRGIITTDPGDRSECCGIPRDEDGFCVHRPYHPIYVAPDLDRAGYDRARRECADELEAIHFEIPGGWCNHDGFSWPCADARRAGEWSSSGRAPAGEEGQR